ncbi:MAG: Rrf2 family transcriptional regulator [Ignavibacteriaceae bacterium]|jgi:Rrf2 family protein|nr:Rrf2 family transcriptional regulator [Ignavibacteriaceae bacterium]
MLKLSKKSEYALMAARYMAIKNHGTAITAKEIANNFNLSYELISKVLQSLSKNQIVNSYKGVKGGYILSKSPADIPLIDLIRAVEPDYQIVDCLGYENRKEVCSYEENCTIKYPLAMVQQKIDKVFFETKLSHII